MRIPLMFFSIEKSERINKRFLWIGENLGKIFYKLKYSLINAGLDIDDDKYLTASFFSALVWGLIFFFLFYGLFFLRDMEILPINSLLAAMFGFIFFIVFFFLHTIYPNIIANKYASGVDQTLLAALRSMLIQVGSGVSLFDAMVNLSKSDYGLVSKEFSSVVHDISGGESEIKSLEKLALRTKSDYMKRTSWQLITSLQSGSTLKGALGNVVQTLSDAQKRSIKDYAAELNLWILVYLLLAAAIPTIGITFLIILSAMGGANIEQIHIILMVIGAFLMQIILIGLVKTRVPKVYS